MANTISILSYTNTFGDWFVNTNALAKENNEFGSNNYIKPTGTLYLNDPNLGLQVANNAIIAGQLQVQGIGSSAYVQNNLRVDTQVYFTNTTLGLTNSGQAIIGKDLLVLGSGTGLRVANNTLIGGTLTANGITQLNNDLNVSGNTSISNTVYIRGNSYLANSITVSKDVWTKNLSTSDVVTVGSDLNVINNSYTVNLQANNVVNTAIVTASDIIYGKNIQANTNLQTQTLNVIGTEYVNIVRANTRIETPKLIITSDIDANAGSILANTLQTTGQLTVGGNFVINGTTVYNTNTFTLNAGSSIALDSKFEVNRGSSGANASIKWSESGKSFGILNVGTGTYWKVVTEEYISGSLLSNSTTNVASSLVANTLNTNINNANTWLKAYTDGANTQLKSYTDGANTQLKSYTDGANTQLKSYTDGAIASANGNIQSQFGTVYTFATNAYARANTSANSFVGTSGTAVPNLGSVTFNSTNGITVVGSANNLTVNTPQDLRATAGPSFSSITSTVATGTSPLTVSSTTQVNNLNAQYLGGNASSFYTSASNLSTGTLPNARLSSIPNSALASSTISGVALGGTLNTLTFGTHLTGSSYNGSGAVTLATNATNLNTGSTLVARDASGNFNAGTITATFSGNLTGSVTGNCSGTAGSVAWGNVSSKPFSYSGQPGQPSWLWGTNDNVTYYVWNPSNFNVNYATTSGTAGNITSYTVNQSVGTGNNVQHNSLGVGTAASGTAGEIRAIDNITAYYSDKRLKENIQVIDNPLSKIQNISGVYFNNNALAEAFGYKNKSKQIGVIAQEIQNVIPEAVKMAPFDTDFDENGNEYSKSGENYLTVQYEKIIPLLIECIKELKLEIEVLKNK